MNSPRKPHVQKNCRSRDIHPQSSDFGQKWQKWCLKKARYLKNGKCYWKSDLIFRICDKLPFLYVWSDFCLVFVFREKIWLENGQFSCIFWVFWGHFLANHCEDFDETWSEVRQNGYKAAAKDQRPRVLASLEIFGLKVGKNRPKSAKIYGWSKNFSKKIFLLKKFLNGPIRKVIMLKVKFEDLRIFFTTRPSWFLLKTVKMQFKDHYIWKSYENKIKGTAITTITATISFQFNFKYNSSHYLSSGVQGSSLVSTLKFLISIFINDQWSSMIIQYCYIGIITE